MSPFYFFALLLSAFSFVTFASSIPLESELESKILAEKCTQPISSTEKACVMEDKETGEWIAAPDKLMWTFDREKNKCVTIGVSPCNSHFGNIYETQSECSSTCAISK